MNPDIIDKNNLVSWMEEHDYSVDSKSVIYRNCGYEAVYRTPSWDSFILELNDIYKVYLITDESLGEVIRDCLYDYFITSRG